MTEAMQLTELEEILSTHGKKYPLMTPQDGVKLIFQNEFGSGHMISDEKQCLERLKDECANAEPTKGIPLYEYIGNGITRVNINSAEIKNYPREKLCKDFIELSASHKGNAEMFEKKLLILLKCCEKGCFGFSEKELGDYLTSYRKEGIRPVSHSEIYRKNYRPAYRIVSKTV